MQRSDGDNLSIAVLHAPIGICILSGPDLVYELINPAYQQLLPGRKLLNRPIFEALPELVGTPLQQVLLNVYRTGETCVINDLLIPVAEYKDGPTQERYFSFSYQARKDKNDKVDGVMAFVSEVTETVETRQFLQKANELSDQQKRVYETITSGTPDLMYVFSLDYRFNYANTALLSMWGKTWDTAIGKGLRENGYEEWHAQMHEREIDQVKATKQSVRGEVSFPHATLGKRIYDYILIPVFNDDGDVEAVAGTTRDVTERKLWEESLARTSEELQATNEELAATNEELAASNVELAVTNEELAQVNEELLAARQIIGESKVALQIAIDAAEFGTWFIHSITREFITDARLKELFGYYPDEDLSIEQALAQITDEYRGYVATKLENAIYHNGDYDVTYPVIGLHDNRLRWLRAIGNLKAGASGAFSAFTGVVMDITEQVLAKKSLESAYEQLRLSKEAAQLGFFDMDLTKGTMEWDVRCRELFGISHKNTVTYEKDFVTGLHPEDKERILGVINSVFIKSVSNGVYDVEYRTIGAEDHQLRWVRAKGQAYFDQDDKPVRFIGSVLDITEQKQDELRKNDFIGMVSHELKTPLTSLTAIVQMAALKLKNSEDAFLNGAMDKAGNQVKRMSNMINSFLNVSRLESAKLLIDKHEFDLEELIEETIKEIRLTASNHVIEFQRCNSTLVNADRDKISSVVTNLISNAIKYSPKGKTVEVKCKVTGNNIQVSIKDEGMGLKPQDIDKVFDRYFRVESNHTRHISGFGIGLYLSAEIIRRHNGKIWVESESGKGSTFYFSLPL